MAKHLLVLLAGLALGAATGGSAAAQAELLMFEQPGCIYCARWNEEVARISADR
jgi:hypothetical protein